ncbi:hypothetical protein ABZ816_38065 [Actinosynnema sp. NPDC047251]|uniref:Putative membrane protein n=1 Tax=Saccharothrix espanaensis (strain ATCC 51144 / DSM 44229 / JCM 9112 / NBRC 15066 / NRRL 15764) TaxID=1179773 RepID=K0JXY7_SACES|nr:hypothetical protein [Saccharothrix espanaensis]CCH30187.1 putative membrane protein [Saccharothrix espanaensis DSM 44229]
MSTALALIHDGALAAGISTVLYTVTVTTATLTALFAPTPQQRCDARSVLTILLRNRMAEDQQVDK